MNKQAFCSDKIVVYNNINRLLIIKSGNRKLHAFDFYRPGNGFKNEWNW